MANWAVPSDQYAGGDFPVLRNLAYFFTICEFIVWFWFIVIIFLLACSVLLRLCYVRSADLFYRPINVLHILETIHFWVNKTHWNKFPPHACQLSPLYIHSVQLCWACMTAQETTNSYKRDSECCVNKLRQFCSSVNHLCLQFTLLTTITQLMQATLAYLNAFFLPSKGLLV